jgi:transcriptional regulator GlxA family with amidase domain
MQRIGFIVVPNFQVLSFAALTVFEVANMKLDRPHYELRALSEDGATKRSSFGMDVVTHPLDGKFDTILVGASMDVSAAPPRTLEFIRAAALTTRRIASICVGAFTLGEAGLLDGRRATTHWAFVSGLQKRFPNAIVQTDQMFTEDGPVWTSAGMTAGIDLALGMVERDHGSEVARMVAKSLVMDRRRSGGQSQHSVLLDLDPKSDRIQDALVYARAHLSAALTVEELAGAARLSPRQFTRVFRAETGQSPAKAIEALRLEAARLMVEQSTIPIEAIAEDTGFGDRERMRRSFLRAFGETPQALRIRTREEER